jgi:predicted nucleic acid-binding protein
MRTAIDTSVLIQIQRHQFEWDRWRDLLDRAAQEGQLLVCPVVFAECAPGYPSAEVALREFDSIQVRFDSLSPESCHLAGETFVRYRRQGGPRVHLIPDFLIAAHAAMQADRIAAIDRGYFRAYFPDLAMVAPE